MDDSASFRSPPMGELNFDDPRLVLVLPPPGVTRDGIRGPAVIEEHAGFTVVFDDADPEDYDGVEERGYNIELAFAERVYESTQRYARHPVIGDGWPGDPNLRRRVLGGHEGQVMSAQWRAPGNLTVAVWVRIDESFGTRCAYCGGLARTTLDHVTAVTRGGRTDADNVLPACRVCNCSKWSRSLDDWKDGDPGWWRRFAARCDQAAADLRRLGHADLAGFVRRHAKHPASGRCG